MIDFQSHSSSASLLFIIVFLCLFLFCFDFVWSSPPPSSFNWPRVQLFLKVPNHIYVLKRYIIHSLIHFGFIGCLYMYLFRKVFGGNSCVTQNWVISSSYAWFSFVKKIHAMSFVFGFSREILLLFYRSIFLIVEFYFWKQVLTWDSSF